MERRRFGLPASGRGRAGVAAAVAGAIGVGLLAVPLFDDPGTADAPAGTKQAAARPLDQDTAQQQAVAAGRRVEVTALRDETSTTYARPDGSFELVAHGAPVRARVNGAWKPIDTSLARTPQGWAARATVDPVVFSAGGGAGTGGGESARNRRTGRDGRNGKNAEAAVYTVARGGDAVRVADATEGFSELATLTSGGHEITLSWPGALPEPTISGSSALYREVLDGVDLMLTAQAGGFSHVLVVHSAEAAADPALTRLSYGLSSPDLTFHLDPVTKIVTGTDRDGQEIAVSPTPTCGTRPARTRSPRAPTPSRPRRAPRRRRPTPRSPARRSARRAPRPRTDRTPTRRRRPPPRAATPRTAPPGTPARPPPTRPPSVRRRPPLCRPPPSPTRRCSPCRASPDPTRAPIWPSPGPR